MKPFGIIIAAAVVTGLLWSDSALAGEIKKRQVKQQARISEGIESGELNQNEIRNLEQEQNRIRKFKRKSLSDGKLTVRERVKIDNMQDRAGKHIYGSKHNKAKAQE